MSIDWFTVAAQAVNFLILVALLKRFLYGPIKNALEAREASIRKRLEDAGSREEDAAKAEERYRSKLEDLESEEDARLEEAREKAEAERKERLRAAKEEIAARREQWQEAFTRDRERAGREAERVFVRLFFEVGERALRDLAGTGLETRTVDAFLERLDALDEGDRDALHQALRDGAALRVETAFEASDALVSRIAGGVRERLDLDASAEVAVEQDADLVFGLALVAADRRVDWTLERYVREYRERALAALGGKDADGDDAER